MNFLRERNRVFPVIIGIAALWVHRSTKLNQAAKEVDVDRVAREDMQKSVAIESPDVRSSTKCNQPLQKRASKARQIEQLTHCYVGDTRNLRE